MCYVLCIVYYVFTIVIIITVIISIGLLAPDLLGTEPLHILD